MVWCEQDSFSAVGYGLQDPTDKKSETTGQRMRVSGARVLCDHPPCSPAQAYAKLFGFGSPLAEGEFDSSATVCSGDSGGPALDQAGRVSGVASRASPDCTNSFYESVAPWRDFIIEKTFEAATAGHLSPPAWAGDPPDDFDPLGVSCTGYCPGAYACWSQQATSSGICVPPCSEDDQACPSGFSCDLALGACVLPPLEQPLVHDNSGCSVSASGDAGGRGTLWLGLAVSGWAFRAAAATRARSGSRRRSRRP